MGPLLSSSLGLWTPALNSSYSVPVSVLCPEYIYICQTSLFHVAHQCFVGFCTEMDQSTLGKLTFKFPLCEENIPVPNIPELGGLTIIHHGIFFGFGSSNGFHLARWPSAVDWTQWDAVIRYLSPAAMGSFLADLLCRDGGPAAFFAGP